MPLTYHLTQEVDIPTDRFASDGTVALLAHGTRVADVWSINLHDMATPGAKPKVFGSIKTAADPDPGKAFDTIVVWVNDLAARAGWRCDIQDLNHLHAEAARPFFLAALVTLTRPSTPEDTCDR